MKLEVELAANDPQPESGIALIAAGQPRATVSTPNWDGAEPRHHTCGLLLLGWWTLVVAGVAVVTVVSPLLTLGLHFVPLLLLG